MAQMTQEQIDRRIAELGGGKLTHSAVATKKRLPNPKFNATQVAAGRSNEPEFIEVDVQQWVSPSGHILQAYQTDGGWEVVQDEPKAPSATASTAQAAPPETKDEGGSRYVWQPNPGGANAGGKWVRVGDAPMTPAERQAAEAAAPTQSVRTEQGPDGRPYTIITIVPKPGQPGQAGQIVLGPDGKPAPGGVPGKPKQEKKTTVKGADGKTYIQVSVENPDGTVELYHTDQAGTRATLPDTPKAPKLPPSVKAPNFSRGNVAGEMARFVAEINAARERGELTFTTQAEAEAFLQPYHQQAQTFLQEQNYGDAEAARSRQDQITQRGQDIGVANSRGSFASNAFQQGAAADQSMTKGADPSNFGGNMLIPMIALQARLANAAGAFETPPNVEVPRALQMTPKAPPNAIGAGQGGTIFKPQGVAPAPAPATTTPQGVSRTTDPAQGGGPAFKPTAPTPAPAPVAAVTPADAAAAAAPTIVTVRNKKTGATLTLPLAEFNARPDVLDWEPVDPNAPAAAPIAVPPVNVEGAASAPYAPQMSSVPPGSTGTQIEIGTPPPPPQAAPFQDDQREPAASPGFQIPRPGAPWPVAPSGDGVPQALNLGPKPGTTFMDTENQLRQKWRAEGADDATIERALMISRKKLLAGSAA